MKKIMRIGTMDTGHKLPSSLFVKAEFKDGNLSLSGVIGPLTNGDCKGGCGQINMGFAHRDPINNNKRYDHPVTPEEITFAPGWDKEKWFDLLDIWKNWHLNDTQAGCVHQRRSWNPGKELLLTEYSWSDKFHTLQTRAQDGLLTPLEYFDFQTVATKVLLTTIKSPVKWESPEVKELLEAGYIKAKKTEIKTAGWVKPTEHPEGILTKPCEICGYKYGTAWLKQDVPPEVIEKLFAFPPTDATPAWI